MKLKSELDILLEDIFKPMSSPEQKKTNIELRKKELEDFKEELEPIRVPEGHEYANYETRRLAAWILERVARKFGYKQVKKLMKEFNISELQMWSEQQIHGFDLGL
jgi:hypothetical protein